MRLRTLLPALLGLALLAPTGTAQAATPAGPGPSTSLSLSLGSCGLSGTATGIAADQLTIKHRSSTGALKASRTVDTSGGIWLVACSGPRIRGGDRLRLFSGDATSPFRTFTVPELTLRTDRANDRVVGTALRTSSIAVRVIGCDAAGFACTANLPQATPVNPDTDRFSVETEDLKGGWRVELGWVKGQDEVSLTQQVAQVIVQPGQAKVDGWAQRPGVRVAVSLRRGQKMGLTSPVATTDAAFQGTLRRGGSPMTVRSSMSSPPAAPATRC